MGSCVGNRPFEIVGITESLFFVTVGTGDDDATVSGCLVDNVGLVLPTGTRLLGEIVDGPILSSTVEGLADTDGPALPPRSFVGLIVLMDVGDDDTEALGNLVDGMLDGLCRLGIKLGINVAGLSDDGVIEVVNDEGIIVDAEGSPDDGGPELVNDEGTFVDAEGVLLGKYVGDSVSVRSTTRLVQYTSANIVLASTSSPSN